MEYYITHLTNSLDNKIESENLAEIPGYGKLSDEIRYNYDKDIVTRISQIYIDLDAPGRLSNDKEALINCVQKLLLNRDTRFANTYTNC